MSDGESSQVGRAHNFMDLTGQRFGRLVAVEYLGQRIPKRSGNRGGKRERSHWRCMCDCGSEHTTTADSLKAGAKSCGCVFRELDGYHGKMDTPEYSVWQAMIQRCTNRSNPGYASYGGRGISVCDRWRHDFLAFLSDMGERPESGFGRSNLSIDRINNDGNYEPENCRWATSFEQDRNKRSNRMIEFRGETKCLMDWSRETGINYVTIINRLNSGWTTEDALTTLPKNGNQWTKKKSKS